MIQDKLQAGLQGTCKQVGVAHTELGHAEACGPLMAPGAAFNPACNVPTECSEIQCAQHGTCNCLY